MNAFRRILTTAAALCLHTPVFAQSFDARVTLHTQREGAVIDPNIYGQFVEHLGRGVYEGIWVGADSPIPNTRGIRNDVVAALKKIKVPVVRWPGGCFAELYHWRDAIGPREKRVAGVNTAWGDEPETHQFGSHEFLDFAEQIGAKPFLSVNLASGSPAEAQAWLQYLTGPANSGPGQERARNGHPDPWKIPYIGIGNETWGCGGNMTAEYYSDLYRQYASVLKPYGMLIASDANSDDYDWTATLLRRALYRHPPEMPTTLAYVSKQPLIGMISIHFYTFAGNDWGRKSPATGFSEEDWIRAMERTWKTDEMVTRHSALLDQYDPQGRVGISFSECGTWWATDKSRPSNLYQVNTLRDAVIAGLTLNIFQNHARRVRMANIAQTVNVLQSMVLTRGAEMMLTPTYHVFDLYQGHQGATLIPASVDAPPYSVGGHAVPSISVSVSKGSDGRYTVSLVNLDAMKPARVSLDLDGAKVRDVTAQVISAPAMDARPEFGQRDPLVPVKLQGVRLAKGQVLFDAPPKSVIVLELR